MSARRVEVADKAGNLVGQFAASGFSAWKKGMGGNVAFLWKGDGNYTDGVIVDTHATMRQLPPGEHKGILVRQVRIPQAVRGELADCDLRKAV